MICIENLTRTYKKGNEYINAVQNFNLNVKKGEFVVVSGPSGSGKTTLLLSIGAMLKPTIGKVFIEDQDINVLNEAEKNDLRSKKLGFVFQMFHLLPYLNILDNIMLPVNNRKRENLFRANELINKFKLTHRKYHYPKELSAGEKQRVAIARAMINEPDIILADEPTGNLDPENEKMIFNYLQDYNKNGGTVILVSHSSTASDYAERTVYLKSPV
ncbi:ABC transporter ATP-binding protein [Bacteroidota bacterium]